MNYFTISKAASDSFIEKKSEFIGYIAPVKTNDEAVAFINEIKAIIKSSKVNISPKFFYIEGTPINTARVFMSVNAIMMQMIFT